MRYLICCLVLAALAGCGATPVSQIEQGEAFVGTSKAPPATALDQIVDVADRDGLKVSMLDRDRMKLVADAEHLFAGNNVVRYVVEVKPSNDGSSISIRSSPHRALFGNSWPRRLWDSYCEKYPGVPVPHE